MSNLKSTIEELASEFAMRIIGALRAASIDELTSVTRAGRDGRGARSIEETRRPRSRNGRLGRRSADDIAKMIDDIVALLEAHPEGLRAEQIREALGCEAKELPRPLSDAIDQGRISKSGQKRATTYFAEGGRASEAAPAKKRGRGKKKRAA